MNKSILIPKLAVEGIRKNGSSYIPYIMVNAFAVFSFFTFSAICDNEIMQTLPRAEYVWALMQIGRVLLALILAPLLFSTNKFLVKQRKNELGLYNVLGLDRKYIGLMMFFETLVIYFITVAGGIIVATIFSKLIFLILINMADLGVQADFKPSIGSFKITIIYFAILFAFNLTVSLWQVFRAKPIDLLKESRKGEKQVRWLGIQSTLGFLLLGAGYYLALHTEVDSNIFGKFFIEVYLIVLGTGFLFKAGSIVILKKLQRMKSIYYQKSNFITISGMLYRMRRNAKSLSNICIFSTMVMVTLICTTGLFAGKDKAIQFDYPLDVTYRFEADSFKDREKLTLAIKSAADKEQVACTNAHELIYQNVEMAEEGKSIRRLKPEEEDTNKAHFMRLITLSDFNACENRQETLKKDEVLLFISSEDWKYDELVIEGQQFKVKEELQHFSIVNKEVKNLGERFFFVVVPDEETKMEIAHKLSEGELNPQVYYFGCDLVGTKEAKAAFVSEMTDWAKKQPGFYKSEYIGDWEATCHSMFGGLLFLGLFFGIVFIICMVLIMYYKQLSEGYEDQRNFRIFRQVGMSDKEIRAAIRHQILLIFFTPLLLSMLHTFMGLHVVNNLLAVIKLFDTRLTLLCSVGVMAAFTMIYVVSYMITSRAYYKIVK